MVEMTLNDVFTLIWTACLFFAWTAGFSKGGQR